MLAFGNGLRGLEVQPLITELHKPASHRLGNSLQTPAPDSIFYNSSTASRVHEGRWSCHTDVLDLAITTFHECEACQGRGFHLLPGTHGNKPGGPSSLCYEVCDACRHGICLTTPKIHPKQQDRVPFFWQSFGDAAVAVWQAIEELCCMRKVTQRQPWSSKTPDLH